MYLTKAGGHSLGNDSNHCGCNQLQGVMAHNLIVAIKRETPPELKYPKWTFNLHIPDIVKWGNHTYSLSFLTV